jgi:hypothetical protein
LICPVDKKCKQTKETLSLSLRPVSVSFTIGRKKKIEEKQGT